MDNDKSKEDKATEKQPADKIDFDSPIQQRVFEKMGMRLRVNKPDKDQEK